MKMNDVERNKRFKQFQITFLIFLVVSFVVGVILISTHNDFVGALFMSVFLILAFAELVLAIVRHSINKKRGYNPNPKTNNSTGGYTNFSSGTSFDAGNKYRATSDSFIKEIDEYVSREFPELPLDNTIIGLTYQTDYLSDIRKTAYEMQKHLGISTFIITISIRKLNDENAKKREAGHFRRTGLLTADIEIDANLSTVMALACLAHEMSHAFQSFKGKQPYQDGSLEEEQFTDFLTYYLGFSNLIKNGYYSGNQKLGYVESGDFNKIEEQYSYRTSSSGSYKKEKKDLKELVDLYKTMVEQTLSMCEALLTKYMPADDKEYIKEINAKYSSNEIKEYIAKINDNIDRRAKININMDQIGVEMKIEELMNDKTKVQRIHDYVFGN